MATRYTKEGVWYIRFKDIDGKWKAKCCGKNATAVDAETIRKKYDGIELNRRHKTIVRIINANLKEQLEKYRDEEVPRSHTGRQKSKKSIQRYKAIFDNFIRYADSNMLTEYADFTSEHVKRYFKILLNDLKRSASTISKERNDMINFFAWSIKQGFCTENPVLIAEIKNPPRDKPKHRYYSLEELSDIFAEAKPPYDNIFKFLALTGLREGELCNLEWSDWDRIMKTIKIRPIEGNKTKTTGEVPLCKAAIAVLEDQEKKHKGIGTTDSSRFIFVNKNGAKLDNANIYRSCKTVLNNCKIYNAKVHTFRHTCASWLAIKGVSLYVIKDILRHADVKQTEAYAHLSEKALADAIEKLPFNS
jgi:site-specific recombinase XerD